MASKRGYELYVVINGELEEDVRESTIERITQLLESQDAEILTFDERGSRRLAYPINGQLEGYDVLYQCLMPSQGPNVVESQLRLSEQILRYLLIRRDELLKQPAENGEAPEEVEEEDEAETVAEADTETEAEVEESAEAADTDGEVDEQVDGNEEEEE